MLQPSFLESPSFKKTLCYCHLWETHIILSFCLNYHKNKILNLSVYPLQGAHVIEQRKTCDTFFYEHGQKSQSWELVTLALRKLS